jgi:pimeloyl-ACP methyl ester carboxylesterase
VIGCAAPKPIEIPRFAEKPATRAKANGIELAWDSFGDGPPVVLIMGIGMQMIGWDESFCAQLAALGFRVIRFDNRDVGLSTWLDDKGDPNVLEVFDRLRRKKPVEPAYRLSDMAEDVVGLLDALHIERAHVIGLSMGGMIAQELAIRHPDRVRSLTSIMSTTGELDLGGPSFETMMSLLKPFPADRNGFIERGVEIAHALAGFPVDAAEVRKFAARSFDRAYHPAGLRRQLVAIWLSGGRRAALRSLKIPALVIHGESDPLIHIEGGRDTANAIAGARFVTIPGLGHEWPASIWPRLLGEIQTFLARF